MRQVQITELTEEIAFAEKAARVFAESPTLVTYTETDIVPGCFFAVRWGLGEDCVVVLKLDDDHIPTNYAQLIRRFQAPKKEGKL